MKTTTIKIPIFGATLKIIASTTFDSIQSKYYIQDLTNVNAFVFKAKESEREIIMVVNSEEVEYSIIAHESLHVANMVFKDIEYRPVCGNDEVQAYLMQWIMENVIMFLERNDIRIG